MEEQSKALEFDTHQAKLIGERIKNERVKRQWTISELAAEVCYPLRFLMDVETNRALFNSNTVERFAKVFGVAVGDLLGQTDHLNWEDQLAKDLNSDNEKISSEEFFEQLNKRCSKEVGERVHSERKARGWDLFELAARSHYNISYLADLEAGRVPISTEIGMNLARALEKDYEWILGGEEKKTPVSEVKDGDKVYVKGTSLKDGVYVARESKDGKYQISFETQPADIEEEDEDMPYEGSHYEDAMEALGAMLSAETNDLVILEIAKAIKHLIRAREISD